MNVQWHGFVLLSIVEIFTIGKELFFRLLLYPCDARINSSTSFGLKGLDRTWREYSSSCEIRRPKIARYLSPRLRLVGEVLDLGKVYPMPISLTTGCVWLRSQLVDRATLRLHVAGESWMVK